MRLIDIKQALNIAWSNIQTVTVEEFSDNFRINNADKLKIALDKLLSIKFIKLNDSSIYPIVVTSSSESILFDKRKNTLSTIADLKKAVELMDRWINGYVPNEQDKETVNIKLPKISNFDVLNKVANELRLAFFYRYM